MKVRRKIMALGTALAMAFVMIASLVLTTTVKAVDYNRISDVTISFVAPNVGDTVTLGGDSGSDPSLLPNISTSTTGMKHDDTWPTDPIPGGRFVNSSFNSLQDYYDALSGNPEDALFAGKFENGKTYKAVIWAHADTDAGYALADNAKITVSGATKLDESIENELDAGFSGSYMLISFTVGESPAPDPDPSGETVPVKDGYANQTVAPGSSVTIGFEKDFSDFNNGTEQGKVYIDGNEVPGQYVNATPGSTIIQIAEEYMKQLSEGAHKMVVKFLDGTEGEASFTVSSSAAASTAANGTSGTASSTAATTTKVTSPKTADVLPIAGIALVFVGATAIGVIAFRRKNS